MTSGAARPYRRSTPAPARPEREASIPVQENTVHGRRRAWELLVLAGILLLAGWLRLRELGLMEFKTDEALAVRIAREILDGDFRTVGLTSSVGAQNPPLFVDLNAIPLAVWDDPRAATGFVGLLAVAAIALTYLVLRPRFGALVALSAAGLFATAPWAVLFGRKLWAQSMLPLFTVCLLWTLFVVLERRRTRAVAFVPILLCAAFQLNFSALALAVPAGAVLLYRLRRMHWAALAAGTAVAVVLLSPWLAHEARHGFVDVSKLLTESRGDDPSSFPGAGTLEASRETARLVGATGWDYVVGQSRDLLVDDAGRAWTLGRAASYLTLALLVLGLTTSAVRALRGARFRRGWPGVELDADQARRALLLVWLAGVWLSHAASSTDRVYPHYLIVTYPVSFAVAALGLADATRAAGGRLRRPAVIGASAAVVAVAACFVAFTLAFQRFVDDNGGAAGDYGVVYRDQAELARAVRERGLRMGNSPAIEVLVSGSFEIPPGKGPLVTVVNRLVTAEPLPCDGEVRSFGRIDACFPRG